MKKPARYLLIDTTGNDSSIAIARAGAIDDRINWRRSANFSQDALDQIDRLLNRNQLGLNDLSAILVRTGPGSFTSSRLGVTIANALAWSNNIPAVGVKDAQLFQATLKRLKTQSQGQFVAARPYLWQPKTPTCRG